MRPSDVDNMCFAQFMMMYEQCKQPKSVTFSKKRQNCCYDDDDEQNSYKRKFSHKIFATGQVLPRYILLSNGSCMRLRRVPKVISIHQKKEGYEILYSRLILFFPWKDENELCANDKVSVYDIYNENIEIIELNRKSCFPNSKKIEEMRELISDNVNPEHLYDKINVMAEQQNEEDLNEMEPIDLNPLPEEPKVPQKVQKSTNEEVKLKPIVIADRAVLRRNARGLSYEQKIIFDRFIHYCQCVAIDKRGGQIDPEPPRIIAHGKIAKISIDN